MPTAVKQVNSSPSEKCGVQETGWHLVFECPVNKESRKANIDGTQTWEDLGNKGRIKERGWKVEAFFRKVPSSKGGARTATANFFNFPLLFKDIFFSFVYALLSMYPEPPAPGCRYV